MPFSCQCRPAALSLKVSAFLVTLHALVHAGTQEPDDLKHILKQLTDVMQDNMRLVRLVLRGQLRPVSSSASTKRLEHYRLAAIEHYYGSNADMSKIRCMVTGEEVDFKEIYCCTHIQAGLANWVAGEHLCMTLKSLQLTIMPAA